MDIFKSRLSNSVSHFVDFGRHFSTKQAKTRKEDSAATSEAQRGPPKSNETTRSQFKTKYTATKQRQTQQRPKKTAQQRQNQKIKNQTRTDQQKPRMKRRTSRRPHSSGTTKPSKRKEDHLHRHTVWLFLIEKKYRNGVCRLKFTCALQVVYQ